MSRKNRMNIRNDQEINRHKVKTGTSIALLTGRYLQSNQEQQDERILTYAANGYGKPR